jgi:hypothetical protein
MRANPISKTWNVKIGEKDYVVEFFEDDQSEERLRVNGKDIQFTFKPRRTLWVIDRPIFIRGTECHLVMFSGLTYKIDLEVEGRFIDCKKPYIKERKFPLWSLFFIIACLIVPIVFLIIGGEGSIFSILCGIAGAILCLQVSLSPFSEILSKVMRCSLVVVAAWASAELIVYASGI